MRTYSKSLAIANRILGSESSKIYYTTAAQGEVYPGLIFGLISITPEQSLNLHSIELNLQEASASNIVCRLVKIVTADLTTTVDELDNTASNIDITLPIGDRTALAEISPHVLVSTYKYGLKLTPATTAPDSTAFPYGSGLSATYVLSHV